jgi:hypothetical protein
VVSRHDAGELVLGSRARACETSERTNVAPARVTSPWVHPALDRGLCTSFNVNQTHASQRGAHRGLHAGWLQRRRLASSLGSRRPVSLGRPGHPQRPPFRVSGRYGEDERVLAA